MKCELKSEVKEEPGEVFGETVGDQELAVSASDRPPDWTDTSDFESAGSEEDDEYGPTVPFHLQSYLMNTDGGRGKGMRRDVSERAGGRLALHLLSDPLIPPQDTTSGL